MRISDWSSDVCSSYLDRLTGAGDEPAETPKGERDQSMSGNGSKLGAAVRWLTNRSEEHTSELQSLMRISYAVFCLKKKNTQEHTTTLQLILTTPEYILRLQHHTV